MGVGLYSDRALFAILGQNSLDTKAYLGLNVSLRFRVVRRGGGRVRVRAGVGVRVRVRVRARGLNLGV